MFRTLIVISTLFQQCFTATIRDRFDDWSRKFNIKFYDEHSLEHTFHKWIENDIYIDFVNSQNLTYTLGHNEYSGMDGNDFSRYMGFLTPSDIPKMIPNYHPQHMVTSPRNSDLPSYVNWVDKGAVSPVKNQGQCGSCWSFSTTGALEGAYYIKTSRQGSKFVSFSEQQLVDCDNHKNGGKDMGCNGGLMDNAFNWIEHNGGLCTEDSYPYTSGTTRTAGKCQTSCNIVSGSAVSDVYDVPTMSDYDMMLAISNQPVSIAIQADQQAFQLYQSGVFTGSCGTKLDHGVLVVGYGTKDGTDYYLVKNSWGTSWGQNGYIMLGRGDEFNNGQGQCGMLLQGSYPEL